MKKSLQTIAAIATASALLVSCNKGVVSSKKLDGSWKVTSGTIESSQSNTNGSTTTTYSSSSTFNGTELQTSQKDGNVTTTVTEQLTIDLTFDKETNAYTRTEVSTNPEYNEYSVYYYTKDGSDYVYGGYLNMVTSRVSTSTSSGIYTLTGDAGDDLEKNSQVVFQQDMSMTEYTDTYTYMDGNTTVSAAGKYSYEWNGSEYVYTLLATADAGTTTNNGGSYDAEVWNVTELKKGEMTVEYGYENEYTDSSSDYSSSSSTSVSWTLTQE